MVQVGLSSLTRVVFGPSIEGLPVGSILSPHSIESYLGSFSFPSPSHLHDFELSLTFAFSFFRCLGHLTVLRSFDRSLRLGCVNSPVGSGSFIKRSVLLLLLGTSKLWSGIATGSRTIYTNWLEGPSPLEGESCQDPFRVIMDLAYL
jgi:hypothetical protein